ncbi:MAG: MCE family protein [FCB group bacterium]|nr:MCE family protein [FCB group bacterium]
MKFTKIFWVGLIISISTLLFVFGLLYLQDISLKKSKYVFTVILDNVQGLNEGDSVTMLGKKIGKVSRTRIIGKQIAIELSIDNDFALSIPIDSKIEVKSEGLMGEKYVAIDPGKDTKHTILAGDTVQGTREFDFSEITPGIVPLTNDLGVFARRLKATLGEEEKEKIIQTIHHIEELSSEMTLLTQELRQTMTDREREDIQRFIQNMRMISDSLKMNLDTDFDKLDSILDDIKIVTRKSPDLAETITSLKSTAESFSKSAESFNTSIMKLNSALAKLDSSKGTLPRLLNDDAIYENMDSLIYDVRWIVKDFKDNPGSYLKAYFKAKKK